MNGEEILSKLNDAQQEAVLENSRPLLVLAGAGSGKTRVITAKIAWSICELGINPRSILAVTFTNKAANEMKERVADMLPDINLSQMIVSTFHSFGCRLLRTYGDRLGLPRDFTVYDQDDAVSLLQSVYAGKTKKELSPFAAKILDAKERGFTPDNLSSYTGRDDRELEEYFRAYEKRLREVGNVDFPDLIYLPTKLLDTCPDVKEHINNRFKVVLVDEYQDTNRSQFELLRRVVGPDVFIAVVGDDDQSIYAFRGAEVKHILSFPDYYPNTRIVKLEQNYRSTKNIIALASGVISHNRQRHEKKLWTDNEEGELPKVYYVNDDREEAQRIANILLSAGNYNDSAVLYRTNAQAAIFEAVFRNLNIPYKVVRSLSFYEHEEVKDAIALISLAMRPTDLVAFKRIVNKPARGVGAKSQDALIETAGKECGGNLLDVMVSESLGEKTRSALKPLSDCFTEAIAFLEKGNNEKFADTLIKGSGLESLYNQRDSEEGRKGDTSHVANLHMLVATLSQFTPGRDGILEFLEQMALDKTTLGDEDPRNENGVTLITMHNTKGLEFDTVFIAGLEENLFPLAHGMVIDDLDEERRLFYVAITRAKKHLFMFSAKCRRLYDHIESRTPSRFLKELPSDNYEVEKVGYDFAGYRRSGSASSGYYAPKYSGTAKMAPKKDLPRPAAGATIQRGASGPKIPIEAVVYDPDRRFNPGNRVLGPEGYGEGQIQTIRTINGREVMDILYDSGRRSTFLTAKPDIERI